MNRRAKGKYSAVLRTDYLNHLEMIRGDTSRDICIQNAILEYLALSDDVRDKETERQKTGYTKWSGEPAPEYHTVVDEILIRDELVGWLQPFDTYGDVDINLHAAIRLWLQARGMEGLTP